MLQRGAINTQRTRDRNAVTIVYMYHILLICRDHSDHIRLNSNILNACMLIRILKDSLIDGLTCIKKS